MRRRWAIVLLLILPACGQSDKRPLAQLLPSEPALERGPASALPPWTTAPTTTAPPPPPTTTTRLTPAPARPAPIRASRGRPRTARCEAGWNCSEASFYGPGLFGNGTACRDEKGNRRVLTPSTVGVANKSLPCNAWVTFEHQGHIVSAQVIDRGPYVRGREWDLTQALCLQLEHCFTGDIAWRR